MVPIRNDGPRLKLAGCVTLQPGLNEVEETAWRECLRNEMTRVFLNSHMIQVVPAAAGTTATPLPPAGPGPISAKDLIEVIKKTVDCNYLRDLISGDERRTSVIVAVNSRMDALRKRQVDEDSEN